jgi:hypothetical protein
VEVFGGRRRSSGNNFEFRRLIFLALFLNVFESSNFEN